jgi:hypothetical protein
MSWTRHDSQASRPLANGFHKVQSLFEWRWRIEDSRGSRPAGAAQDDVGNPEWLVSLGGLPKPMTVLGKPGSIFPECVDQNVDINQPHATGP